jgi:inhibitor of cysteine peptidase
LLFRNVFWKFLAVLILLILAACSPDPGQPGAVTPPLAGTAEPDGTQAVLEDVLVESVDALILESFPVQVNVVVEGQLPDACSFIEKVEQERQEDEFKIHLAIARRPEARCAPQPTPFEQVVSLDVLGLEAGAYTVDVHGVTAEFELSMDNVLEATP